MVNLESVASDKMNFTSQTDPRVPCIILCDTSSSMFGEPIQQLNDGLKTLRDELNEDRTASKVVDLAIVKFDSEVEIVQEFRSIETSFVPTLVAGGSTAMGAAVNTALDLLEIQKTHYNNSSIPRRRGWIFLISDGAPTDKWSDAAARAIKLQDAKGVLFLSIGVEGADLNLLGKFSRQPAYALQGLRFVEFFKWLSKSMKAASHRPNFGPENLPSTAEWTEQ